MNTLFKLDIPKRSLHCSCLGERLQPGMEIYSLLLDDEPQRMARRDYCSVCWKQVQADGILKSSRGYWKSKIEEKKAPAESSRVERALALLRELIQAPETHQAEIFVLSLFLAHARQLALRQEFKREEGTYQLYEVLRQDEFMTVKVMKLSLPEIETIQKTLALKLNA